MATHMKTPITASPLFWKQFCLGFTSTTDSSGASYLPIWLTHQKRVGLALDNPTPSRSTLPDGGRAVTRHCPGCHSIVYSRRHRLCGVCFQSLPPECLFGPSDAVQVESLL